VLEFLNETDVHNVKIRRLGMPDGFIEQGQQNELRKKYGLDEEGIYLSALSFFKEPLYSH
jgi:deoxyxylulose-5-phosphate synthase